MGCICKCHEKCKNKYMKKEDQAQKDFEKVKKEINESMINIHETLEGIKDWDSFFHSNEKIWFDDEKIKLNKIDIDSPKYNKISYLKLLCSYNCEKIMESRCVLIFFFICGIFSCLIQLIGVQAGIIIINSIFKEIVDEIKLLSRDIPRKYNFYENLEISTYKTIPDLDVGMTFCFLGTLFLKNYNYYISNFLHILATVGFILLFYLFDFHKGKEPLNNYSNIELTVLIFAYINNNNRSNFNNRIKRIHEYI